MKTDKSHSSVINTVVARLNMFGIGPNSGGCYVCKQYGFLNNLQGIFVG